MSTKTPPWRRNSTFVVFRRCFCSRRAKWSRARWALCRNLIFALFWMGSCATPLHDHPWRLSNSHRCAGGLSAVIYWTHLARDPLPKVGGRAIASAVGKVLAGQGGTTEVSQLLGQR